MYYEGSVEYNGVNQVAIIPMPATAGTIVSTPAACGRESRWAAAAALQA